MRYSVETRDGIFEIGYGLLSFAKNMSKALVIKKTLDQATQSASNRYN